jgi:nucleoid-associated protein EbfC
MFRGLANLGALLKHARQLSGRMEEIQQELKRRRATGTAGGGMVEIEVNGLLEVLHCRIDPALVAQADRELLEDLVAGAVTQAIAKGRQLHVDALKELTGGLELPGIQEAIARFAGDEAVEDSENDAGGEDQDA